MAEPAIYGVWRNPKDTVHLEIKACQTGTCGYVIWASPKAKAEALKGSGKELVGQQLFRNMSPDSHNVWRGQVYVPDMNKTFSGSAEVLDSRTLKARGCLIGNIFCKTQHWTRVSPVAD
jgi:uncharacterized protein (DUF2147 family)